MINTVPESDESDDFLISDFPSIDFTNRGQLPDCAAVYFVVDSEEVVQYIGATQNLYNRFMTHHKRHIFSQMSGLRIAWIDGVKLDCLGTLEKACIQHFKPVLNPPGRKSNPDYTQITALIPLKLHKQIKLALLEKSIKENTNSDFSGLLEDLLSDWLAEWKAENTQ